jgi:hypothetical protein
MQAEDTDRMEMHDETSMVGNSVLCAPVVYSVCSGRVGREKR